MKNKLKKTTAFILSALMIYALLPVQTVLAEAEPSIMLGSATYSSAESRYYYNSATVSGTGIQTILVNFSGNVTSGDDITLPATTPDGFTVSGNSYSKRISIDTATTSEDNALAVQAYVRGIGFSLASATTTQTVNVTVTTQNIAADTFYNIATQHYYQFIPAGSSGITWTDAYDAAKGMTYMGRTGYLATVMSLDEDKFLNSLSGGSTGWLGGTILTNSGSRVDADGDVAAVGMYYSSFTTTSVVSGDSDGWYWACGPEIGTIFYDTNSLNNEGGANSSTASTVDTRNASTYYNWSRGASYEPNNQTATQSYDGNDYETGLTTLINSGHTGKHGTEFTWNDCRCFYTDQSSSWSAKGYFVEYGDKALGDNTAGTVVAGYATGKGTLRNASLGYAVTINTYIDEVLHDVSGVMLRNGGDSITADDSGTGCYTVSAASLASGTTYEIYVGSADTGKDVTYNGSAVSIDVDYYTVSFDVQDAGAASGGTISATADGAAIYDGDAVLKGAEVVITAASGTGADSYTYLWSGNGTNDETAASLTKASLGGTVDAVCTVTGTTAIAISDATWQSAAAYTCSIDLSPWSRMVTISVDSGYFTIPSCGMALTYRGGTNGTSYIDAYGVLTQYESVVFSYTDVAAAETLLSAIIYTPEAADPQQTITATSSTVSPSGDDLYFGGHFYRYVAGTTNWPSAMIAARGITDPYFDGHGYIATATSQAENSILLKLVYTAAGDGRGDSYFDAYMGGLWQRNTGTVASPSITKGTDDNEITCANIASASTDGTLTRLLPDYSETYSSDADDVCNGTADGKYIYQHPNTVKYYWVDGPEAGQEIENNVTGGFSPWHSGEPNSGDFVYIGWQGAYWDDQSADVSTSDSIYAMVDGYIVEFSGFEGGSTIGKVASDTKTVSAAYPVTLNLNGGTVNSGNVTSYTYRTGATLPTPTMTGNDFGGWYIDSGFSGSAVTAISTTDIGAKEYWAKWTAATYPITYNLDGGTNPDGAPASYIYGTGVILPTPTKTENDFVGWYTDSGFSGSAVTTISLADTGAKEYYAKWTEVASYDDSPSGYGNLPSRTITVTETSSDLFIDCEGLIQAEANMNNAFSSSVEVKVTNTGEDTSSFGFGAGSNVYPFDISLYIKGTNTKTEPVFGYAVTISLPIPEDLLDVKNQLSVVHKSEDGTVTELTSSLKQIDSIWYLVFDAMEFSPYALVVSNLAFYDAATGLPYYLNDSGTKVFIGFAADGNYLAPDGETVLFMPNPKSFTDISSHWGKMYIDFVTEREIFVGTDTNVFSPDTGMTRAMFATVIGRLYERSYGEISTSHSCAFTDCNYNDYYGKYVGWAAENGIVQGVGDSLFQPDRQVSRQEMATLLYRFAEFIKLSTGISTDATLRYSDASGIASWAEDAALYCQETGIITGRTGGSFAPTETATRAEVATIIQRFVELTVN